MDSDIIVWHKITGPITDFISIIKDGEIQPRQKFTLHKVAHSYYSDFKRKLKKKLKNPAISDLDVLAGDHNYVFLAMKPLHTTRYFPERFKNEDIFPEYYRGFGFSVYDLIQYGAEVGTKDLLNEYRKAMESIIFKDILEKEKDLSEFYIKSIVSDIMTPVAYLYLQDHNLLEKFEKDVKKIQKKYRYKGKRAWDYVQEIWKECHNNMIDGFGYVNTYDKESAKYCSGSSKFGSAEILFPGALPISLAEYFIFDGYILPIEELEDLT